MADGSVVCPYKKERKMGEERGQERKEMREREKERERERERERRGGMCQSHGKTTIEVLNLQNQEIQCSN